MVSGRCEHGLTLHACLCEVTGAIEVIFHTPLLKDIDISCGSYTYVEMS